MPSVLNHEPPQAPMSYECGRALSIWPLYGVVYGSKISKMLEA